MPGYVPNQCSPIIDLCYKKKDFCPKNPEEDSVCRLPDLCRVWTRRRDDQIKPGCWDDPQVCLYHPWDPNSPYQEQEEISMIFRSNVFPGYTYTGKRFSTYDAFFNATVFKRRCESSIPHEFRKKNTDFTKWMQKMIQDKVLIRPRQQQKSRITLQPKTQTIEKSIIELLVKSHYDTSNLQHIDSKSMIHSKPNLDQSNLEKTDVDTNTLQKSTAEKTNVDKTIIKKSISELKDADKITLQKSTYEKTNVDKTTLRRSNFEKTNLEKNVDENIPLQKTAS